MRYFVTIDGRETAIEVRELPNGSYDVRVVPPERASAPGLNGAARLEADVFAEHGLLSIRLDGRMLDLVVDGEPPRLDVFASGRRAAVSVESARTRAAGALRAQDGSSSEGVVTSPMPGKVVKVLVAEGDEVDPGSPLVVVEAMKMENELTAERAGTVEKIHVQPGDAVEGGARLVSVR